MNFIGQALSYLSTASNWAGPDGLTARVVEHLEYTALAVAASALIAVPIGLLIGHTGRGQLVVVTAVNGLPSRNAATAAFCEMEQGFDVL